MELRGIRFLTVCLAFCISVGHARAPKKIVHGYNANDGEFPYQVSLQTNGGQHYCGGSIIDAYYILTAAHCVNSPSTGILTPAHGIKVVTGVIDIEQPWDDNNVFEVAHVIPHEKFDPTISPFENAFADIALLKLARPIPFDNYRQPILLPEGSTVHQTQAILSGWGHGFYNAEQPMRILQKLPMTIVNLDQCRSVYGNTITVGNICAKGNVQVSGTCQGDSGGPLVANQRLVGIVSWSYQCAKNVPDVFTNVHNFLPWISSVMKSYSKFN